MHNEIDDFTIKVGASNMHGLVQGDANAIAPGKRPLRSMSPFIARRNGKSVLTEGTLGESIVITAVTHTILNVID